jgi:Ca2+-binding EF-hand superfamily protein
VTKDTVLRYDVEIIDILPPVPNDFKEIDSNKDWKISRIEAKSYFERKNQNIDLDALFQAEDTDGDGYVSYEEFTGPKGNEGPPSTRQKQPRQQADPLDQVTAIFQTMDRDGDGKIIKRELQETFDALGEHLTDEFWAKSDANGDGHISFAEFVGNEESGDGSGDEEL